MAGTTNDFLFELQATLDKLNSVKNINRDIEKIKGQIKQLQIQAKLNPDSAQVIAKQLENIIGKKIVLSDIGIDQSKTVKMAQQTGQQIGNAINQGIETSGNRTKNILKSFIDLKDFSELNKSVGNFHVDASELKNYKPILDAVKNTYSEFGQVKITNEIFKNGVLEKFKVNIEQVNGDLKETRSFMMALNEDKDAFIFSGLISGSESVVQHLDKTKNAVNQTADAINALREKAQVDKIQLSMDNGHGASEYQNRINSIIASLEKYGMETKEAQAITSSLQSTFDGMKGLSGQELVTQADKLEQEFKAVKASVEEAKLSYDKLLQPISSSKQVNLTNKIEKWLSNNKRATKSARQELELYLKELSSGNINQQQYTEFSNRLTQIDTEMRSMGKLGKSLFQSLSEGAKKFTSWISATAVVMRVITTIRQAISTIKDLDTALVDLKKTAKMSATELKNFYLSANDTAKQMGVSTKEIIEQAAAWSRLNKMGLLYGDI